MAQQHKKMQDAPLPKVVVIGGGTGLSVMLRGLKKQPLDLTAIVTVADDGGSSGRLRAELDIPPPGDLRNVMVALATSEPLLRKVLQHRFSQGEGLAGHSLGNLILAALTEITGDFVTAVKEMSRVLSIRGRVLPAAGESVVLSASLEDGTYVLGESNIPLMTKLRNSRIDHVRIIPEDVPALEEAVEAIREADAIVIGPGSLYTSIIPNILVTDIARALRESTVKKILICNVMTQPGETDGFSVADHLKAVRTHLPGLTIDVVLANDGYIPPETIATYAAEGAEPVTLDADEVEAAGARLVTDSLVYMEQYLRHDAIRLSEWIVRIIREEESV